MIKSDYERTRNDIFQRNHALWKLARLRFQQKLLRVVNEVTMRFLNLQKLEEPENFE